MGVIVAALVGSLLLAVPDRPSTGSRSSASTSRAVSRSS